MSAVRNPGADGDAELDLARAMIGQLDTTGRYELLRALRLTLRPADDEPPAKRRTRHLGYLAEMLRAQAQRDGLDLPVRYGYAAPGADVDPRWLDWPRVPAAAYDEQRPEGALSSEQIAAMFGSNWTRACRAVWGLQGDGSYVGLSQPWKNQVAGKPRIRYERWELLDAIRQCARRFGRRPSIELYQRWAGIRRAQLRAAGEQARIPTYESFRQRWGGWPRAVAAARITDEEIAQWRAELPMWRSFGAQLQEQAALAAADEPAPLRARDLIDAITDEHLAELGVKRHFLQRTAATGFGRLNLDQAIRVAQILDGSLDWIAQRTTDRGTPPPSGLATDGAAVRALRLDRGVTESTLCRAIGKDYVMLRNALAGKAPITFGDLTAVAGALDASVMSLLCES